MEKTSANIYQKLVAIQNEMAAPKDQKNEFGKYQYRTLEAINERLKPLLDKYACTLYFNDEVYTVADTAYLKTTATLIQRERPDGHRVEPLPDRPQPQGHEPRAVRRQLTQLLAQVLPRRIASS